MNRWIDVARLIALGAVVAVSYCQAQTPPTKLQVDVSNFVLYNYDTFDTSQFGTNPSRTSVAMKTYNFHISVGDIVAVGGTAAKGTLLCRSVPMFVLRPNPTPGTQAIADVSRNMMDDCALEVFTADGVTAIGTVFFGGLYGGPPPPSGISGTTASNMIITGGTGAFLGVRGQAGHISYAPRVASVTEDPANRRTNGGGTQSLILQLLPMFRPEVVMTSGAPAVVHSSDFGLVTVAKPAKAGEILSVFATGLGPTNPGVEFGQPFPAGPPQTVKSAVEVRINGSPAEVLYAGGYPGVIDGYQVNFRVPAGTTPGTATLGLTAGFIAGGQVTIQVQ
jgi:hypothetical protein